MDTARRGITPPSMRRVPERRDIAPHPPRVEKTGAGGKPDAVEQKKDTRLRKKDTIPHSTDLIRLKLGMNETRQSLLLRAQTGEADAWKDLTDLYRPLILGWLGRQGVQARDLD